MPNLEKKEAIYPVLIFRQAWVTSWLNLVKLAAIYLIFSLPLTILSLSPAMSLLKTGLPMFLWFLFTFLFSSWGNIALLLGSKSAVESEKFKIGQAITGAVIFLPKYIFLLLIIFAFAMGSMLVGGISAAVIGIFLWQVNKIASTIVSLILVAALVSLLVYFLIRWSQALLVCVIENNRIIASLKRSFSLVKNHVNPIIGVYCLLALVGIIATIPLMVALIAPQFHKNAVPESVTTIYINIVNIVLAPLGAVAGVVLYKKLKEINENNVHP